MSKVCRYNPATHTYDYYDGTTVPAEIQDGVTSLAGLLTVLSIRDEQRKAGNNRGQCEQRANPAATSGGGCTV